MNSIVTHHQQSNTMYQLALLICDIISERALTTTHGSNIETIELSYSNYDVIVVRDFYDQMVNRNKSNSDYSPNMLKSIH